MARTSVRYAVVVCERTQAQCPRLYPFARETLYWPFEDPAAFKGTPTASLEKFREVRDQIAARILFWLRELRVEA
jgi:arsenate reductase